jgi:organic hydroperoxide reductase OsmC/OhrA
VQVARALRIEPKNVRITVTARYSRAGSVLAGDATTTCDSIHTALSLDSEEPPERIAQLITMAEATCFTMAALRNPAPVALEATVNGQPFNPGMPDPG